MEESLAGYPSGGAASSWKAPVLPSKPCQFTLRLMWLAPGQAYGTLQAVVVLQAYLADLLKILTTERGISRCSLGAPPHHRHFPLCHQASAPHTIGCSLAHRHGCHAEASALVLDVRSSLQNEKNIIFLVSARCKYGCWLRSSSSSLPSTVCHPPGIEE